MNEDMFNFKMFKGFQIENLCSVNDWLYIVFRSVLEYVSYIRTSSLSELKKYMLMPAYYSLWAERSLSKPTLSMIWVYKVSSEGLRNLVACYDKPGLLMIYSKSEIIFRGSNFGCLLVHVPLKICRLQDVTVSSKRPLKSDLCSALTAFEQRKIFIVPYMFWNFFFCCFVRWIDTFS